MTELTPLAAGVPPAAGHKGAYTARACVEVLP